MGIEDSFNNRDISETERARTKAEINKDGKYLEHKEERAGMLKRFFEKALNPQELLETVSRLVKSRGIKQECLREEHRPSAEAHAQAYQEKYALIEDGDYESTPGRQKLYAKLARETAYYEQNPTGDWTESDGEVEEREFVRGVVMHRYLQPLNLSNREVVESKLDIDKDELEVTYNAGEEKLEVFDKESAEKAIDYLFDLRTKVDSGKIIKEMQDRFGCQEATFILEDIYDSWQGYSDNTMKNFEWIKDPEKLIENLQDRTEQAINASQDIFERYQTWDEYYLVNDNFNLDNLSKQSQANNWNGVGVTNNRLNALINDYGELRISAWEEGESEFVEALDNSILNKFKSGEIDDEEAGVTVIRMAKLRSFLVKLSDAEDEEEREKIKDELLKVL